MNRREQQTGQADVVLCRNNSIIVREPKLKVDLTRYVEEHNFMFDQAFDETVSNEQLYCVCVQPIIDAVFNKAKCTCFAYGQTGSGKTFTMMGPPRRPGEPHDSAATPGIFLLAAQDVFRGLASKEYAHLGVYIAFYEIYCGKLFDLLNNRQILHARENAKSNVVIVGLQEHPVENVQELMEVIEFGLASRTTGVTFTNVDSSRSHAILQISLKDLRSKEDNDGKLREHGKISFIDLAGSERGADTLDTDRQTRMDGAEINKSLLALKECIRALDQQLDHTPFRGSKLTQVLKDSFVGSNCRTVMIANVSPAGSTVEHSLNTLRYAYRVKELRRGGSNAGGPGAAPPDLSSGGGELGAATAGYGDAGPLEESSGDDGSGGGAKTPRSLRQQMREAQLGADRPHSFASPRDGIADSRGAFDARGGGGGGADLQHRVQQPEEVMAPAPRYTGQQQQQMGMMTMPHGGSTSVAGPEATYHQGGAGDPSGGGMTHQAEQHLRDDAKGGGLVIPEVSQELAPEVALEPVCSQAALDELARQHDRLIGTILAEEEELITAHRQHIDTMVELIKEEMVHLNNVDRPGSDVDAYVAGLDRILHMKAQYIGEVRSRVDLFKDHLQQEDALSRKFQSLASSSS